MPPALWANNAYDDITSTPNNKHPGDYSTASTAGASVTPTATATAAGAPTTKKKATKNIDNILQDFSDGDSSFVSDPSAVMSNVSGVGVPPLAPS